eukprot:18474-Heterococcus_DN1.PRE.2
MQCWYQLALPKIDNCDVRSVNTYYYPGKDSQLCLSIPLHAISFCVLLCNTNIAADNNIQCTWKKPTMPYHYSFTFKLVKQYNTLYPTPTPLSTYNVASNAANQHTATALSVSYNCSV